MTRVLPRAAATSLSTGTGPLTLSGPLSGTPEFPDVLADGVAFYYSAVAEGGTEWEVGIGALLTGALVRTTVLASSNSNAIVSFSAGIKTLRAMTPDGLLGVTSYLTVPGARVAAGVPTGAPVIGENGIAFDTTASTGGLYAWNGAAWVKASTIP